MTFFRYNIKKINHVTSAKVIRQHFGLIFRMIKQAAGIEQFALPPMGGNLDELLNPSSVNVIC